MKSLKPFIITGALTTVGLSTLVGVGLASAESGTSATNPASSLVDKIASTFNLNKADVQKVFDDDKSARQAEHDKVISDRLQTLVDKGTITAAQKSAIETKLQELKTQREADKDNMKNLSASERKAKMDAERTDLENWAKSQGIDLTKLPGIFMGGHGMRGMRAPDTSSTPSSS